MIIQTLGIVGAGSLGTRIALQGAISGFKVNVYDIDPNSFERSKVTMRKLLAQLDGAKLLDKEKGEQSLHRISFSPNLKDALQEVDFVSENVTEDLETKLIVWKLIGESAAVHAIFTTNTSFLLPSQLAEASGRPARFCAFHFHDVFQSRVVDIMPHSQTDTELIGILQELGKRLDQVPVLVKKEHPGYIFNTLLIAWIDAAGRLLTGDIAEVEAIDKSWMVNFNMSAGPFGILDKVGLDTAWHITNSRRNPASRAFAALLKTYVDQGKLGIKSGEGFYSYPNPRYENKDFCT
ncbi:3-hydroxyacyl-CoA dehydrogenase NAD-binding domain-containing protein [Algoriphagus sp. AGSA1]|uniref:3-hydroxyacyl-CoA dehydrogenase NAD-binding domain-containing protein n=1 Tax=Algoriphagus sp. AGSA1 TaxID=2907213 RepID=UPI001F4900C1|nr:3-hydroxyacyl-CoA dehydrogenase NAD-binding domain-containing protein [Algoriphagus sp. AGSA1]MCE7054589.1 3-hydroxyacyl-CoA dehydrogenase NAD-binding domain-containing protein [Algoriphagus sp. AGSA1]